ncbi:hypothetical protein NPIL_5171, partial [Nephila pilipes]
DNEENFLLGFKIMLNLFRSEKLPPEVALFIKRFFLFYRDKVVDVNIRQGRTSFASVRQRYVSEISETKTFLPKASESLCVLGESLEFTIPILDLLPSGFYSHGIIDVISITFLNIINLVPDEESK